MQQAYRWFAYLTFLGLIGYIFILIIFGPGCPSNCGCSPSSSSISSHHSSTEDEIILEFDKQAGANTPPPIEYSSNDCPPNETITTDICVFKKQILADNDRNLMRKTFRNCLKILNLLNNSTAYFLYRTSLLGYYRHDKSLIPWQDVIHVALFSRKKGNAVINTARLVSQFRRHLAKSTLINSNYSIAYFKDKKRIKFYGTRPGNSKRIITMANNIFWRWPYIEIQIMDMSSGENGNITEPNGAKSFPVKTILPLRTAKFEGLTTFVPYDVVGMLERYGYNVYECHSLTYSHRHERHFKSPVSKSCYELRDFVNFTNLPFFEHSNGGGPLCPEGVAYDDPLLCTFLPQMTPRQKKLQRQVLSVALEILNKIDNTSHHFLFSGTLIGYWRHNGSMIPWDDDVDIGLFSDDSRYKHYSYYADRFAKLIEQYPGYGFHYMQDQARLKVFGTTSFNSLKVGDFNTITPYEWRWPYVDIQLMDVRWQGFGNYAKITHIVDASSFGWVWPIHLILPLQKATFETLPVYVPEDVQGHLANNFDDIRQCQSPWFNHRFEHHVPSIRQVVRPCRLLSTSLGYKFTNIDDLYYDDMSNYYENNDEK